MCHVGNKIKSLHHLGAIMGGDLKGGVKLNTGNNTKLQLYASTSGPQKLTALTVWSDNASENTLQKTCKLVFVQNSFIFCTKLKLAGI